MTQDKKAWKPKSFFPKVRARTKARDANLRPAGSMSLRADQPFSVVECKAGSIKGMVAYHLISRESPPSAARKKQLGREGYPDEELLGQIDFRKRKRGK